MVETTGDVRETGLIVEPFDQPSGDCDASGAGDGYHCRQHHDDPGDTNHVGTRPEHQHREDYDLVVLPTAHPLAYSLAGPAPQVVVSEGLCDSLTDAQVDAVIAHEVAHLTHRHPDLLSWASVAAASLAWWPLTGRSHRVLRNAFERWADEDATGGDHGRRIALREAIVATVMSDQPTPVAAFSLADATAERVAAMDEPPSAPLPLRLSVYLPGAAAAAVAVIAGAAWMSQAQLVVAMAGRCTV